MEVLYEIFPRYHQLIPLTEQISSSGNLSDFSLQSAALSLESTGLYREHTSE